MDATAYARRARTYLIVGLVLAALTGVALLLVLANASAPEATNAEAMSLVAVQDIEPGVSPLEAWQAGVFNLLSLPFAELPADALIISPTGAQDESVLASFQQALGEAVIAVPVHRGEPLRFVHLAWNAPVALPDGHVAIGVELGAADSLGGILQPGDRVDVVAAYTVTAFDEQGNEFTIPRSTVVLQDVLVVDIRERESETGEFVRGILPSSPALDLLSAQGGVSRPSEFSPVNLVVLLAVSLEDAAKLHYVQTYGDRIALVLRNPGAPVETSPPIVDQGTLP